MSAPATRRKVFTGLVAAVALTGAALLTAPAAGAAGPETRTAAGTTAVAASCYGGERYIPTTSPGFYPSGSSRLTTSSRCNDINLRITNNDSNGKKVRVCFYPSSGGLQCQSSWKRVYGSSWRVIATDVRDGTRFKFQFSHTTGSVRGYWAG